MTTHPEDRTDERIDDTITVTTVDVDGRPTTHDGPIDTDGQPIFPPEQADSARLLDSSARRLPDGSGYPPPVADTNPVSPEESYSSAPIPGDVGDATYAPSADERAVLADERAVLADEPAVRADEPPVLAEEPAAGQPAHLVTSDDEAWLALQGAFVDDPAQAVRDAGHRIEQQLATFRSALDESDTEALRKAFKAFRDLSTILR